MPSNDSDSRIGESLDKHELAVKRALESLGTLEDQLVEVASDASADDRIRLEPLGRALETHVQRLEDLVRTLDDHKRAVYDVTEEGQDSLAVAIERSRRRARQEPTPPVIDADDDHREE